MCSYKVVRVKFELWGLQTRVESFTHRVCCVAATHDVQCSDMLYSQDKDVLRSILRPPSWFQLMAAVTHPVMSLVPGTLKMQA